MWWMLAARAGAFDETLLKSEFASPKGEVAFFVAFEEAPPEARELLQQAFAQYVQLLQAQEQGKEEPELQAAVERAYERVFAAYAQAMTRASTKESSRLHAQLGFLLSERQRHADAAKEWNAGIALDPGHPLAAASHVALGDYLFERQALRPAMAHYREASAHPRLGQYAWYKLAWCHHNLSDTEQAVDALLRATQGADGAIARQVRQDLPLFVVSSPEHMARQALASACEGQARCLDELLARLAEARAEVALPP